MKIDMKAKAFYDALYPNMNEGKIECRWFKPYANQQFFSSINSMFDYEFPADADLYFGVNLRVNSSNGKKKNILEVNSIHAEIDYGPIGHSKVSKYKTKDEAFSRISRFYIKPSAIIHSGGGLHCYWFLKEPLKGDLNILEETIKNLGDILGADKGTHNIDRILRIPLTTNFKNDAQRPVTIEELNNNCRYSFEEIKNALYLEKLPISNKVRRLILSGKHTDTTYPSRSERDFAVICELQKATLTIEQTKEIFKNPLNAISDKFIAKGRHGDAYFETSWLKALKATSVETNNNKQSLQAKKHPTEKKPLRYIAHFEDLVDLATNAKNEIVFLVLENDQLIIKPIIDIHGDSYLPPPKENLPFFLPRAEMVMQYYKDNKEPNLLYMDLVKYFQSNSELPEDKYYDLLTIWTFHSYLMERAQYSPILCFFADAEKGKTRTCKGLTYVAFRGIHIESLREAFIFRFSHDLHATLFFDVLDVWKKAEKIGSEDLLLQRFERGAKVPRVLFPDKGAFQDIKLYDIFGPTIIATNCPPHHILGSRMIPISMPESDKIFEEDVTPNNGLCLKEQLVAWRARTLKKTLPEVSKIARGRLGDILKPLHQILILINPEKIENFKILAQQISLERKEDKAETLEAKIIEAVFQNKDLAKNGYLSIKNIAETINEGKSSDRQFAASTIGKTLKSLSFRTRRRGKDGAAAIELDELKLERLRSKYGLLPHYPSVPSDPSVPHENIEVLSLRDAQPLNQNLSLPLSKKKPMIPNSAEVAEVSEGNSQHREAITLQQIESTFQNGKWVLPTQNSSSVFNEVQFE